MRNDDYLGGFENLAKGCDQLAFCCAIQKLSPVGGPLLRLAGFADQPSRSSPLAAGSGQDDVHPAPRTCFRSARAVEVRTEAVRLVKAVTPRPSPVYAGR